MTQTNNGDQTENQANNLLGMTNGEFEVWKEEVQMEAIKLPKHASHWFSNSAFTLGHS